MERESLWHFVFGCQLGPRRCLLAVHSSLPVASAPLLLVLLFRRLFCPVVSGGFSYPFAPFFLGGGRGSPLICCDSCHCEAPHRVSALVSSAAQTQQMVLKQTMMALSHRRPRLNNARAAGQCPAQLEPPSVPLASHTAPEPVSLPWSRGDPALKCCAGLAKRWHDQNHSVEQNRANEQAALTVTAAFSSAFTEAK